MAGFFRAIFNGIIGDLTTSALDLGTPGGSSDVLLQSNGDDLLRS